MKWKTASRRSKVKTCGPRSLRDTLRFLAWRFAERAVPPPRLRRLLAASDLLKKVMSVLGGLWEHR